jgi:isocitrate/isopropylmalate dehydrogenase
MAFPISFVAVNSPRIDSKRDLRCFVVGILKGEGSGPELIDAACNVLDAVAETCGIDFRIKTGGNIASRSTECPGGYLSDAVAEFCRAVFADGGAVMAGATGGRFVYDMRRRFFCITNSIHCAHITS